MFEFMKRDETEKFGRGWEWLKVVKDGERERAGSRWGETERAGRGDRDWGRGRREGERVRTDFLNSSEQTRAM
jgi:hypothetical protein